jgi:AraC-like DNA-binding protein
MKISDAMNTTNGKETEQIKVWRLPQLPGIELHRGKAVTRDCPRHWHEELHLCVIESGSGELHYHGTSYSTPARSLFIVPPGEIHANYTREPNGCHYRNLYIHPNLLRQTVEHVKTYEIESLFSQPVLFNANLINLYLEAHRGLEGSASRLEQDSLLLHLLVQLIRNQTDKAASTNLRKESDAVSQVRDYIVDNYQENVPLMRLAEITRMSPYYLNRVFCLQIGMPPHAFQTQVRVLKAKKLLREGCAVSAVASATGFADQSHLTRHFKQLVGVTPGIYSKMCNND